MNCHQFNLIIFILELVNISGIVSEKSCLLNKLFVCPDGESCKQVSNSTTLGVCDCKNKFKRFSPSGPCIEEVDPNSPLFPSPSSVDTSKSTGSTVVGGLVIAFLLILLTAGLVYAGKKYRWVHRVREKAQQLVPRGQYPVLVSQEDDPPLA